MWGLKGLGLIVLHRNLQPLPKQAAPTGRFGSPCHACGISGGLAASGGIPGACSGDPHPKLRVSGFRFRVSGFGFRI